MIATAEKNVGQTIVIQGVTKDGRSFRPSDWAERMSGMLSTFGDDHRIHYSPQLKPVSMRGVKCIALDPALQNSNPAAYRQIMDFAQRNELKVIETTEAELEKNLD
jgi:hypothetical protein